MKEIQLEVESERQDVQDKVQMCKKKVQDVKENNPEPEYFDCEFEYDLENLDSEHVKAKIKQKSASIKSRSETDYSYDIDGVKDRLQDIEVSQE